MRARHIGYIALILLGIAAPFFFYPTFLMKVLCFALFATAFNLLLGFGGLLSFGHAAFFGGAAYICATMVKNWGLTPELGILAGAIYAAVLGALYGWLAVRRSGIYFAMITLALAQIIFFLALQLPFTGGEEGITGVPRGRLLGIVDLSDNLAMYYFVLGVCAAGFWFIYRTIHSPFGHALTAIRENEPRAVSLGYDVSRYKLLAFILSATVAGVAGALKALVFQLASLTDVHWHMSGQVVLMTIVGGLGTIFGPAVGALTIVTLENQLADRVGSWVTVIMGFIFVMCVMLFRRGMVGEFNAWLASRRQRATAAGSTKNDAH